MSRIVCLGMAVRDLVFEVPRLPAVPQKLTASAMHLRGGGMAATAAVAAAALGASVEYWGRLGDDDIGRDLRRDLQSRGVQVEALTVPGTRTPVAAVMVAGNGERMLAVFRGRLDDSAGWLPLDRLAAAQAVLADFRWLEGAQSLYTAAVGRRIARVLDADVGDPAALHALLPLVDHAIFSQQGLADLVGTSDVEQGLRKAAAETAGVVAATLGERGSMFLIDGTVHHIPAPVVEARDSNGAGDVFHGAYTFALTLGRTVVDAAHFASAAAALKCLSGGGWEAVPDREAVNDFMKGSKC